MADQLMIGRRLQIDRARATIRYIGEVAGQDGQWIGLEWDDASRGKHDGCLDGRQYFQCMQVGNAGSFVRASKLLQVADFGQDLPAALAQRCVANASWHVRKQAWLSLILTRSACIPACHQSRLQDASATALRRTDGPVTFGPT